MTDRGKYHGQRLKTEEVLRLYAAGERDFRGAILRGCNFRDADLSDIDFSKANIQGATFQNSRLQNAIFCYARAGNNQSLLPMAVAVTASFIIGAMYGSGIESIYYRLSSSTANNSSTDLKSIFQLMVTSMFCVNFVLTGFNNKLLASLASIVLFISLAEVSMLSSINYEQLVVSVFESVSVIASIILFPAIQNISTSAKKMPFFWGGWVLSRANLNEFELNNGYVNLDVLYQREDLFSFFFLIFIGSTLIYLVSNHVNECISKSDKRFDIIRALGVILGSVGGTRFSGADLSNSNFSYAHLDGVNYADLESSSTTLTHVRWHNARKLERARFGISNLQDPRVRNLLVTLNGIEKDFFAANLQNVNLAGATLHGTNLKAANLTGAELSGANLHGANLAEAKCTSVNFTKANLSYVNFFSAQVSDTNFTRAILTGICIQNWQTGNFPIFAAVECDFVFRLYEKKENKFSERLPVDLSSTFALGEFEKWMEVRKGALDTIDITFADGINWRTFFQSLQTVRQQHQDTQISMQAIEENNGIFVSRLKVETEVSGEALQQLKADIETQVKATYELQLAEAKGEIKTLERTLDKAMEKLAMTSKYTIHGGVGNLSDVNHGNMKAMIHNHYGNDAYTIFQKLDSLREYAQSFPEEEKRVIEVYVEDLTQDLQQTEKPSAARLKTRLVGLLGIAIALGTHIATATDFANNVLELADKLAVPTVALQPQLEQLKEIHPTFDWQRFE